MISEQEYDFEGNAHGPDVSFFSPAKQPLMDLNKRVQRFVPDLAVEIASESDTYEGLMRKKGRYLRAGVSEVWLISPEAARACDLQPKCQPYSARRGSNLHAICCRASR